LARIKSHADTCDTHQERQDPLVGRASQRW
jgi:hypothetical protein